MKIYVTIRYEYGKPVLYPACAKSKLLCELAGTQRVTTSALRILCELGYEVMEKITSNPVTP